MRRLLGGATGAIDWVGDTSIKIMILTTGTAYTFNPDHEFVSDVVSSEAAGTGYTGGFGGAGRKALSGKTIVDDLTNDKVLLKASDPATWTGLNLSSGSIAQLVVFKELTNDASSPLLGMLDPADLVTNGGDVSCAFPSGVVFSIAQ
jgi:hypothetical protein